MIHRSRYFL